MLRVTVLLIVLAFCSASASAADHHDNPFSDSLLTARPSVPLGVSILSRLNDLLPYITNSMEEHEWKELISSSIPVDDVSNESTPACKPKKSAAGSSSFMFGVHTRSLANEVNLAAEMGATDSRAYVLWRYVQPTLSAIETNISVELFRQNPSLIYEWSKTLNWKVTDGRVDDIVNAGINPVVEVGEGTVYGLPTFNGKYVDPNFIGVDLYLAYQYRFCRAAVRRYKSVATLFQVENELNEAFFAGLAGQRVLNLSADSVWRNMTFLTQLLQTLVMAVKDEAPTAFTTTNLLVDVPQFIHTLSGVPAYYVDAAQAWAGGATPIVDILSFDTYPNTGIASPLKANSIATTMAAIRKVVSSSVDIFVMETGYSVANQTDVPAVFDYSTTNQADFAQQAFESVYCNGGTGLFYFLLTSQAGIIPPPGGYNDQDVEAFTVMTEFLQTFNISLALQWISDPTHILYAITRMPSVLKTYGDAWGLLTASGKPRPAYNTLKAIYQNYSKIVEPAPLERLAGTQPELRVPVHPDLAIA